LHHTRIVKAFVKTLFFVVLILCANNIFAQDNSAKDSGKLTRAEKREAMSKKVATEANGDIVLERPKIPKWDVEDTDKINSTLLLLLSYINPKTDIKKFAKALKSKAPDTTTITSLKTTMPAVTSAFATENVNFASVTFTANAVRGKIDTGIPVFAWFYKSEQYENEITERTHLRPLTGDMKDWSTRLRKLELKNIAYESNGKRASVVPAIIVGYNKTTSEYFVRFDTSTEVWMTDDEVKKSANIIYNLRL